MTQKPRPKAVLFDLFNTLVPGGGRDQRDGVAALMAVELGVDPRGLAELIRDTFDARTRGALGDLRETVTWLAAQLRGDPSPDAIDSAVDLRLAMNRDLLARTWALPTLETLSRLGVPMGLVTDCSAETPAVWGASPLARYFDAVSFSCITGHRKPEPPAYLAATDSLGIAPEDCLFVGDGSSRELSGAAALRMKPIRFVPSGSGLGEPVDEDVEWTGAVVTDLREIVSLAGYIGEDA